MSQPGRLVLTSALAAALILLALPRAACADEGPRRPAELFLALGPAGAACGDKKPESSCPVDGGIAFGLGGAWRFAGHFAVGAEVGAWAYKVRDSWQGQLADSATDVSFTSSYVAPFARWYWFDHGPIEPYLQLGVGAGSFKGKASNAGGSYEIDVSGVVWPAAIGAEWILGEHFRLGPQALAYLQKSSKVCESVNGADATCKDATSDQNALPWRIVLVGTFLLGSP